MTERVGAVIVLRRDGAALLQLRDNKPGLRNANMWVPPGGHAESNEPMIACARRELREETEYDAADLHYLMSYEDTAEGWPTYHLTIFWTLYDEIQSFTCHEGQVVAFIPRPMAANHSIPEHLLIAWDAALAAADQLNFLKK